MLHSKLTVRYRPRTNYPNIYQECHWELPVIFDLNVDIVDKIDSWDWREKLMNNARISSQHCQYLRKDWEDQWSCAITTHGLTPSKSRCVVPPIWKPWPLTKDSPSFSHTSLHQSRNHILFIGAQEPSAVSNANSGDELGMLVLDNRWCSNAEIVLHSHVELDM